MDAWRAAVLCLLGGLLLPAAAGYAFPTTSQADWEDGSFTDTEAVAGRLQLQSGVSSGTYTSPVFDAGDAYAWDTVDTNASLDGGTVTVTVQTSTDDFATVAGQDTVSLSGGQESVSVDVPDARYARFNYTLQDSDGTPLIGSTNLTLGGDVHFIIRDEPCLVNETVLFSMSGRTNAHAAAPGFYGQRVCGSGIDRADYDTSCSPTETAALSFFGSDATDVHLATDDDLFSVKLCTQSLSFGLRSTCPAPTKAVASIYERPESHIAEPGHYSTQLCGGLVQGVTAAMTVRLGGDTVYRNGTESPPEGINTSVGPVPYITTENSSLLAGIVAGQDSDTLRIGFREDTYLHLNMTQAVAATGWYLPFATADHIDVEDRQVLIREGTFLDELNPNFGDTFLNEMVVRLTADLAVDLVTDLRLSPGAYTLAITNTGTQDGTSQVSINVTR